jgi:hypothetical protein
VSARNARLGIGQKARHYYTTPPSSEQFMKQVVSGRWSVVSVVVLHALSRVFWHVV